MFGLARESSDSASWRERLRAGLARTREALAGGLDGVFRRPRIDEALYEALENTLLAADCGVQATGALVATLRQRVRSERIEDAAALRPLLREALAGLLAPLERRLDLAGDKPRVIMLAGVNGAGKTTTIGKLAHLLRAEGRSALLAAGDTFRAAAREQLIAWGEKNGVPVVSQVSGDPGAVVYDAIAAARARAIDVVIADTAGRLPTQLHLMEEIAKVKRVAARALAGAPHEVLLVLDGGTGQNAVAQVKAFDDALGLTGLVVTKLDGSARGGVLAAIARERPVPVVYVGVGEAAGDLRPFSAAEFAAALVD